MEKIYQFLCEFSKNTHPTKNHLVKRYGEDSVNEAIELGLICLYSKNSVGELTYTITQRGIEKRDK